MSVANFHLQNEKPTKPGRYWVVDEVKDKAPDGTVRFLHSDCGYEVWDGQKWGNTEGWKYWYGEAT